MAGDEDTSASPEEPAEASRQDEQWERFRDQLRLISPRFELQEIVVQLSSLVRRRAEMYAPEALLQELLGDVAREAIKQLVELLRQDGELEFADELAAVLGRKKGRGHPKLYNDDDDRLLFLAFCNVVEAQAKPNVLEAAKGLAEQEPWRSQGHTPAAIRTRLASYLKQDEKGEDGDLLRRKRLDMTLAEFARDIWQAKREKE